MHECSLIPERHDGAAASMIFDAPVPLWRNWRFQFLWIGSSSATLGVEAADVAYPLLILALTHSPAAAGFFGFLQFAVILTLGLPVGRLVDGWNKRRVLLAAEAGRAILMVSVAVAAGLHHLTLVHLMAVAVLLGIGATFGGPVRMLMIRAVVPASQLTSALTQDEVREGWTGLAGPPLGGLLYGIARALPFVFCAASFALSFACALVVRVPPPDHSAPAQDSAHPSDGPDRDSSRSADSKPDSLLAGVQELWRAPLLRCALVVIGMFYLTAMAMVLVVIVLLRSRGTSPGLIGLALTGTAVGTLAGSFLVKPLHRLMTPGRLLVLMSAIVAASTALLAVPLGAWWVFGVLLLSALTVPAMRVLVDILIFRRVPDHRRGRTIMATMTAFGAGPPLGALTAGLLLEYAGSTAAALVLAGMQAAATAYGVLDRRVANAQWPPT